MLCRALIDKVSICCIFDDTQNFIDHIKGVRIIHPAVLFLIGVICAGVIESPAAECNRTAGCIADILLKK